MNSQLQALAKSIVDAHQSRNGRTLIAIGGPPGCGKSYIVEPLQRAISTLLGPNGDNEVITVSQDGWHFSRSHLDSMPDPVEAHWRRGAAFTFDAQGYLAFVRAVRADGPVSVGFNDFDHAVKDPTPTVNPIMPSHRIIIIEGLYTLFDQPTWRDAADVMDVRIWIDVDPAVARERVIARNHAAGIVPDLEACIDRVDKVDMENARVVREAVYKPTHVVHSV